MNFNSLNYIFLFLPATWIAVRLARRFDRGKLPQACILSASLLFFAIHDWFHLPYLLFTILFNWQVSQRFTNSESVAKKSWLQLGVIGNVLSLFAYRYADSFMPKIAVIGRHHCELQARGSPLGISFFTLAQIMYLVDCYEGLMQAVGIFDYATFLAFFPNITAGPISRARKVIAQFPEVNSPSSRLDGALGRAAYLFSLGLTKKVVLADSLAVAANYGFGRVSSLSPLEAWAFISLFTLQLYFDFSGYSDMAIASALFLGMELPRNFDGPLRSLSLSEFWRRWHITLSDFITMYIYTPLLRLVRRPTLAHSAVATLIAMAIAGLWHGPAWTFVLFGVTHGVGLVANQHWKKSVMWKLPNWLSWSLTFGWVDLAFVFFRSPDLHTAFLYYSRLLDWGNFFKIGCFYRMNGSGTMRVALSLSQLAAIVVAICGVSTGQAETPLKGSSAKYAITIICGLFALICLLANGTTPFLYSSF